MAASTTRNLPSLELAASLLTLVVIIVYTFALFFLIPYPGFEWSSGRIVAPLHGDITPLLEGDRIIQLGDTQFVDFRNNRRISVTMVFGGTQPGDVFPVVVERNGETLAIPWVFRGGTTAQVLSRLMSPWYVAFMFWAAGEIVLRSLRPKDIRWRLLLAYDFLTAIWLASGATQTQILGSSTILRSAMWLCVPVYWHLHWVFPKPLARLPAFSWPIIYVPAAGFVVADWLLLLPTRAFYWGFMAAVTGSLMIGVARYVLKPEQRTDTRFLLGAAFLALIPSIVVAATAASTGGLSAGVSGAASLLFLPILPFGYLYTAYRRQLGNLEFRVNRAISVYFFFALVGLALFVIAAFVQFYGIVPRGNSLTGIVVGAVAGLAFVLGIPRFQRAFESRFLGIRVPPAELVERYAAWIATSLDTSTLVNTIQDQLLPSLLIRQSALYRFEHLDFRVLYTQGVDFWHLPTDLPDLLAEASHYRPPIDSGDSAATISQLFPWVRLILPLTVNNQAIGLWLFGRRDPDDYYSHYEISVLRSLANQTAIAINNIAQAERLRNLYQANIDQREAERASLARELHDHVLGLLAHLKTSVDERTTPSEFGARYDALADCIRHTISGLRPSALNYGLSFALNDLLDSLADPDDENSPELIFGLDHSSPYLRHDPQIELYLYRIAQQACANALQHARARTLSVRGCLSPDSIQLTIEDDGVGFDLGPHHGAGATHHFGLDNMRERADIIGARFHIDSAPGHGTRVAVTWQPNPASGK